MHSAKHLDPAYRTALIVAVILNVVMFFAEGTIGLSVGSAALLADAIDFLEDTGMYSLAILAIGWSVMHRTKAGFVMSLFMMGVGLSAIWQVVARLLWGGVPSSSAIALTAAIAFLGSGLIG